MLLLGLTTHYASNFLASAKFTDTSSRPYRKRREIPFPAVVRVLRLLNQLLNLEVVVVIALDLLPRHLTSQGRIEGIWLEFALFLFNALGQFWGQRDNGEGERTASSRSSRRLCANSSPSSGLWPAGGTPLKKFCRPVLRYRKAVRSIAILSVVAEARWAARSEEGSSESVLRVCLVLGVEMKWDLANVAVSQEFRVLEEWVK
jgi:hypothetical protein